MWNAKHGRLYHIAPPGLVTVTNTVANVTNIVALVTETSVLVVTLWLYCSQTSSPDRKWDWYYFPPILSPAFIIYAACFDFCLIQFEGLPPQGICEVQKHWKENQGGGNTLIKWQCFVFSLYSRFVFLCVFSLFLCDIVGVHEEWDEWSWVMYRITYCNLWTIGWPTTGQSRASIGQWFVSDKQQWPLANIQPTFGSRLANNLLWQLAGGQWFTIITQVIHAKEMGSSQNWKFPNEPIGEYIPTIPNHYKTHFLLPSTSWTLTLSLILTLNLDLRRPRPKPKL